MAGGLGYSCGLYCFLLVILLSVLVNVGADRPGDGLQSNKNGSEENSTEIQLQKILKKMSEISDRLSSQEEQIKILSRKVGDFKCNGQAIPSKKVARNCAEIYRSGKHSDGIYIIDPDGLGPIKVFCDMTTDGGGWTLIQKRFDGSVKFYRGWNDYKKGFGLPGGEHWLGLENIYRVTSEGRYVLRVDLRGNFIQSAHAQYSHFALSSESSNYTLVLGSYSGSAGDSLSWHRGMAFTTKDRDNDKSLEGNCATFYKGAWWYNACIASNLNGVYYKGDHSSYADGINWKTWGGFFYSASKVSMKIRPADFRE